MGNHRSPTLEMGNPEKSPSLEKVIIVGCSITIMYLCLAVWMANSGLPDLHIFCIDIAAFCYFKGTLLLLQLTLCSHWDLYYMYLRYMNFFYLVRIRITRDASTHEYRS